MRHVCAGKPLYLWPHKVLYPLSIHLSSRRFLNWNLKCKQRVWGYWWCHYPYMVIPIFREILLPLDGWSLIGNSETSSPPGLLYFKVTVDSSGQNRRPLLDWTAIVTWWGTLSLLVPHQALLTALQNSLVPVNVMGALAMKRSHWGEIVQYGHYDISARFYRHLYLPLTGTRIGCKHGQFFCNGPTE